METVTEWIRKNSHVLVNRKPDEPLDDLRPLAPLVRDARIVALGAAARQTHELSDVAHRIVRLLVGEEGFRSLALEGDDPGRLSLDVYVATGDGDPRVLLGKARPFWQTAEILGLVHWMRSYNERHPRDPVRFARFPAERVRHATRLDGLADLERTLADGMNWWQQLTGDKVVYWGGMAHTAVGAPRTVSPSEPLESHQNSLLHAAAGNRAGYVLNLGASQPQPIRRLLDAPTRTRLIGPFYDPSDDAAHHMSGGSLASWFDVVVHTQEVTPSRPLP
ncbi:erythromycin esterase family protein [Streptomyces tendae]|uniref:erythromycin esterase family protein n=1 Tax=Streptomyces tendae TaxID=1932 RepID=UPI0037121BD4